MPVRRLILLSYLLLSYPLGAPHTAHSLSLSLCLSLSLLLSRMPHRRYVDSIDTCEAVLLQYPDYPRIREEILKKAQGMIRGA